MQNINTNKIEIIKILIENTQLGNINWMPIKKIYRLIGKTFKIAVSDRIIQFNPMDSENIARPKSDKPDI